MARVCLHAWLIGGAVLFGGFDRTLAAPLSICTFECDATPPLGSALCLGFVPPAKEIVDPLSLRGVVLLGDGQPIVLCALDWVSTANGGYDALRESLARAAGTTADRVAVHCLHPHDAPGCDFDAAKILEPYGLSAGLMDVDFARRTFERAAEAVRQSLGRRQRVTHLGIGAGVVERVASNRRVLGADGKVKHVRYSADNTAEGRDAPEGVIDPRVRLLAFYDGERPLAVLTYYATHPQSHYGQGGVSHDFVGMARQQRERASGVRHIHFNGASGNVAAGKYNDGSPANRAVLAERLAAGMGAAYDAVRRVPLDGGQVGWRTREVKLPISAALAEESSSLALLENKSARQVDRLRAALDLAWTRRVAAGRAIQLSALRLGEVTVLHMPGELFIEYQLAAADLQPKGTVCLAAYGDDGPGYIGTEIAYSQGGYETGYVSRVSPQVEKVLRQAMAELTR